MSILWTVIIGFIIGLLARFIKPGDDQMGIVMTTLLGIAGAFVGALLGQGLGLYVPGEPAGILASLLGAVLILFVVQWAFGRRKHVVK